MEIQTIKQSISKIEYIKLDFENKLQALLDNSNLVETVNEYKSFNSSKNELGFNVFSIISDTYYKEDFHSDILKALLDTPLILNEFLHFLNQGKSTIRINPSNYEDFEIVREDSTIDGRIDISIKSKLVDRIIIFENKINNAGDQPRQIPRYVNYYKSKKYKIDSIVYLSIDGLKSPYTNDWHASEINFIIPKLVCLPAYNSSKFDLFSLLLKCESRIENFNTKAVIRPYCDLIKYLGRNIMNKPIMNNFTKLIKEGNNFETIQAIKDMFLDLPKFRALYLKDRFETTPYPFQTVDIYKDLTTFFNTLRIENSDFAIDIYCTEELYTVSFFDRNADLDKNKSVLHLIGEKSQKWVQKIGDRRIYKYFKFPKEEEKMIEFIDNFRLELAELIKNNPATNNG